MTQSRIGHVSLFVLALALLFALIDVLPELLEVGAVVLILYYIIATR